MLNCSLRLRQINLVTECIGDGTAASYRCSRQQAVLSAAGQGNISGCCQQAVVVILEAHGRPAVDAKIGYPEIIVIGSADVTATVPAHVSEASNPPLYPKLNVPPSAALMELNSPVAPS